MEGRWGYFFGGGVSVFLCGKGRDLNVWCLEYRLWWIILTFINCCGVFFCRVFFCGGRVLYFGVVEFGEII